MINKYDYDRKYDDAIKTFILNKDTAIFGAIDRHKLFPYVKESIMDLMNLNQDLAIRLLLDNEDLISHEKVVHLLGNHPKIQVKIYFFIEQPVNS